MVIFAVCTAVELLSGCRNSTDTSEIIEDKRYVSIGFDDFRPSDFSEVIPLFNQYDARGTFNVISNGVVLNETRARNIDEIRSGGHELGDHTWMHEEYPFTDPLFKKPYLVRPDKGAEITGVNPVR